MALNVNRWLKYAKARLDSAVGSGHESLDRLEAEREAERADKPWLTSDSTAPTFDEARARIDWEADQQAKQADRHRDVEQAEAEAKGTDANATGTKGKDAKKSRSGTGTKASENPNTPHRRKTDADPSAAAGPSTPSPPTDQAPSGHGPPAGDPTTSGDHTADPGPGPRSPQQIAEDAELETARLELEDRQRKSAERLDQIRQELGIEDTPN